MWIISVLVTMISSQLEWTIFFPSVFLIILKIRLRNRIERLNLYAINMQCNTLILGQQKKYFHFVYFWNLWGSISLQNQIYTILYLQMKYCSAWSYNVIYWSAKAYKWDLNKWWTYEIIYLLAWTNKVSHMVAESYKVKYLVHIHELVTQDLNYHKLTKSDIN